MNKTVLTKAPMVASHEEPGDSAGVQKSPPCRPDPIEQTQPAREHNISAIISYFESGIKQPDVPGEVGIELEHIIVDEDMGPVSYSEPYGIEWVLQQLNHDFPQTTRDAEGDLLGVARPGDAITIEPAAQLELSAGPCEELDLARMTFESFERQLADILSPVGHRALTMGYHPTAKAMDLELIPKQRYQFMDRYLGAKGPFGPYMMRGSASTQVSIDYYSVADCLRKFRLAFALVPLFALITDNAPVFEGEPRTQRLIRTHIWRLCDSDRCGLVPDVMESSFDLRRYAEYILDTPAILIPRDETSWCYSEQTFGDIYATQTMERADVEHALSMFFTDVRLKTYIEIRPADSMPIPYVIAYAALIKGLFYHAENLDELDDIFTDTDAAAVDEAKDALMQQGYEAHIYGHPVAELADTIMALARRGLSADEQAHLDPLAQLVTRRVTLAELSNLQE